MRYSLTLIVCLVVATACSKRKAEPEHIRPVQTEVVLLTSKKAPLFFSGFSKSEKMINASFRVPGLIVEYPIKVGDRLEKGQLIARLDPQDYELKLKQAQAALEAAVSEDRKTTAQYKRIKMLYESESASRDEFDQARAAHEAARAEIARKRAQVNLATQDLGYTTLVSEQDNCEVSTTDAEVNENVEAGKRVATLSCGKKLEVEVAVPESEIYNIKVGDAVSVLFNITPDIYYEAEVTEVGVTAAKATAYPVTVVLKERAPQLRSGMAAKVIFYKGEAKEAKMTVPLAAVGEDREGNFVFVFEKGEGALGIARKRKVVIGEFYPDRMVIKAGLKPGEVVITAGLRYLREGRRVKLLKYQTVPEKKL